MAFIKEERFTNEEGIEMIREYFGKDEDHISATVERPVPVEVEESEIEEELSQDEINAEILLNQMTIIAKLEEIGNV